MTTLTSYVVMVYGSAFLNVRNKTLALVPVGIVDAVNDQAFIQVLLQALRLTPGVRQAARQLEETP